MAEIMAEIQFVLLSSSRRQSRAFYYTTPFDFLRHHSIAYDTIRLFTTAFNSLRHHSIAYDTIRLLTTSFDCLRHHSIAHAIIRLNKMKPAWESPTVSSAINTENENSPGL